jgi:hypothetical protein
MWNSKKIKVRARIAGIIQGNPVNAEQDIEIKEGATVKFFFKHADKEMGFKKPEYFRLSLKQGISPTVLLNGDRLDLPEGFDRRLVEGDEVSVILPMSGG